MYSFSWQLAAVARVSFKAASLPLIVDSCYIARGPVFNDAA